jgi:hypothetical protein
MILAALILATAAAGATPANTGKLEYNRDIRPILSENCFPCHGPDKNQRKAKLRLDILDAALEKKAFVPGKPGDSELVKRIFTSKQDDLMPPPDSHKQLARAQKELLKRWVAEGAEYQPHWAYIKPVRPAVPAVKNAAWIKDPIDAFILHDLEAKKLTPSAEADKRVLLRRLSLDLIGLPPTPQEVEAFLADTSPLAYERQVDRLLQSPHYGERMAVPWLDVVRFADTVGYHGDQNVNVFPYRDYVINSFNQNKLFDQFTIEQIAGDLLPNPTTEQLIATGFNRLNMVTREGGAQPKEYMAKYAADRVRTVSVAWLGSTMGCCECHDHKFDPFSTKDFYSMEAFFADLKQWGVYNDYSYTPNPDLKGFSNDHPFPPEITVDSPYLHQRMEKIEGRMQALEAAAAAQWKSDEQERKQFEEWRRWGAEFFQQSPEGWVTPAPAVSFESQESDGKNKTNVESQFTADADGSILFSGKPAEATVIKLPLFSGWLAAVRIELLPREEHDGRILLDKAESTTITLSARLKALAERNDQDLSFYRADADHKETQYREGAEVIGVNSGWKTSKQDAGSPQTAVWLLDPPRKVNEGEFLALRLGKNSAGCVRVSLSPFAARDPLKSGGGEPLRQALSEATAENRLASETYFLSAAPDRAEFTQYKKLERDLLECRDGRSPTVVTVAREPVVIRILRRGNWQDESGEIVQPDVPHFLPQPANPDDHRLTRLDLARWLVSRDNPLTARAVVNRLWKQFFGTGLSAVVDDLGAQGEWPVHPELLDWLAVEFMDSGWDVKHIVKLMVMSSTYRQISNPRPEMRELDPANRLLASQSPRRLEAEFIRDNALFIAGLLNEDIGGPSAHPYQPAGYYLNLQFPNRDYVADQDDRQYRRGVYTHWQRTFLQPMLANFDAPGREECTAIRNVSNSPQQALTLLNDPTFVEASRALAAQLLSAAPRDDARRFDLAYEQALSRPVKSSERKSLEQFLAVQREYYRANPADAKKLLHVGLATAQADADEPELAAWTQVCRVVLNLHETITRY